MSDPFIAEIIMFGGNFAPRGWAFCDGQLLDISSNTALFALIGTTYGGDGRTSFALPDLRGRVAIHPGRGPGLSIYTLGRKSGVETVTLSQAQIPSHNHSMTTLTSELADDNSPIGNIPAQSRQDAYAHPSKATANPATGHTGGSQGHTNIQPFCCVNYIIALIGVFPSRS